MTCLRPLAIFWGKKGTKDEDSGNFSILFLAAAYGVGSITYAAVAYAMMGDVLREDLSQSFELVRLNLADAL